MDWTREDRLLIVNADDFGLTRGTNDAVMDLFARSSITSASLMMTGAAAKEAVGSASPKARSHTGIHLTLSSGETSPQAPLYRGRALRSLVDEDGFFHADISLLERQGDPEEVRLELEAQIQGAIQGGIDPTHLDSHAGSVLGLHTGRDFLEPVFELCCRYGLPFNLPLGIVEQPSFSSEQKERFQRRIDSARRRGIVLIDDMASLPYCSSGSYEEAKRQLIEILRGLRPGITQLTLHPSQVKEELKAATACFREREMEYRLLIDRDIRLLLETEKIKLLSWREIRELQRAGSRAWRSP
ncbi:ChbG/HpnK family deacetylase [Paenibacillus sp. D51F]